MLDQDGGLRKIGGGDGYGGQRGENWFYQHYNVWENEKLQQFFPDRSIESRARRRQMSAEDDFNHKLVAEHQKQIDDAGGLITAGSHGQLQGLGAHWEIWALTHGGMSPLSAIRAATINGAIYLGMDEETLQDLGYGSFRAGTNPGVGHMLRHHYLKGIGHVDFGKTEGVGR